MTDRVLVDTGPLISIVSIRDQHHQVCVEQLKEFRAPLLTCWPVLTEAAWILRNQPKALQRLLADSLGGLFKVLVLEETALPWAANFLRRYQKLGAQLADACLVYLAERDRIDTIFTLDRRDFSVYRYRGNRSFKLLPSI
jgi:predicted nucleic acid-binding protein